MRRASQYSQDMIRECGSTSVNTYAGRVDHDHIRFPPAWPPRAAVGSTMTSTVFTIFMPVALALVMFGLGLTLTVADFHRVLKYPKATAVALTCQLVVLPAVCFGLVLAFDLQGSLAVGMMLLVAAPGGITANLLSHLAGGDVALNITLTAINSLLAAFALPIVVGLATWRFLGDEASIGLQFGKFVQVLAVVLIPVAIGVWARHRFSAWAERMRHPVKIGSAVVLALVILAAVAQSFDVLTANMGRLGAIALLLSMLSLTIGYFVPRLFRVSRSQSIASAMEIGIHNVTVAIIVAVSVIGDEVMAVPAAVYGVVMFVPAGLVAYLLSRRAEPTASRPPPGAGPGYRRKLTALSMPMRTPTGGPTALGHLKCTNIDSLPVDPNHRRTDP